MQEIEVNMYVLFLFRKKLHCLKPECDEKKWKEFRYFFLSFQSLKKTFSERNAVPYVSNISMKSTRI
jgi:hypothetical protein